MIYLDGANMNAILGITRPGDFGADMMHYNPHKTFSGPHGGGGPGAGPICVTETLGPTCPLRWSAVVTRTIRRYFLDYDRPESIGRVRAFFGNVGVLIRAYCYIRTHGPDGLRARLGERRAQRQLPAQPRQALPARAARRPLHARVRGLGRTAQTSQGLKQPAMDLGKRLLDFGFHAPTVYFPLTVHDAMMIEPTETESKETLDAFAEALFHVSGESAELLHDAPHTTVISRPDEVAAARKPILKWTPAE